MRSLGGVIVDPADIHIKQILTVNYDALKVVYASNSRNRHIPGGDGECGDKDAAKYPRVSPSRWNFEACADDEQVHRCSCGRISRFRARKMNLDVSWFNAVQDVAFGKEGPDSGQTGVDSFLSYPSTRLLIACRSHRVIATRGRERRPARLAIIQGCARDG